MVMFYFLFFSALWLLSGAACFIYWWTTDNDFTTSEIPIIILVSFTGPLAYFAGWVIHGKGTFGMSNSKAGKTLIKRK
jgi:hypothetical protein